jgi:nitrate reductase beta subunit
MGPLLYDMDKVAEIANLPEKELVDAQRDLILDPHDPEVIAAAKEAGISDAWLDACRRSPVYRMVKEWKIALPLHAEFRTLPSLFYIPPESPVKTCPDGTDSLKMVGGKTVLPNLDEFRLPVQFLSSMLSCGDDSQVETALLRQLAVRGYRRSVRVEGVADTDVLASVGLSEQDAKDMHRILSLAHYHERFVVPTTRRERTDNAPFIERGYAGFSEMTPGNMPQRSVTFHGNRQEVGS